MLPFKYFQMFISNILVLVFETAKYRSTYRKTCLNQQLPCRLAVLRDWVFPTSCSCAGSSPPFAESGTLQVENSHSHTFHLCTSATLGTCGKAGSAICLDITWVIYSSEAVFIHLFIHSFICLGPVGSKKNKVLLR